MPALMPRPEHMSTGSRWEKIPFYTKGLMPFTKRQTLI